MTLTDLERLHAEATPGQWRTDDRLEQDGNVSILEQDNLSVAICATFAFSGPASKVKQDLRNAELIAALRNEAPALLAARRAMEQLEQMRGSLEKEVRLDETKGGFAAPLLRGILAVLDAYRASATLE